MIDLRLSSKESHSIMTQSQYIVGLTHPDTTRLVHTGGIHYMINGNDILIGIAFFDNEGLDYVTTIQSIRMANRMLNAMKKDGWVEHWTDETGTHVTPPLSLRWPKRSLLQMIKRFFSARPINDNA